MRPLSSECVWGAVGQEDGGRGLLGSKSFTSLPMVRSGGLLLPRILPPSHHPPLACFWVLIPVLPPALCWALENPFPHAGSQFLRLKRKVLDWTNPEGLSSSVSLKPLRSLNDRGRKGFRSFPSNAGPLSSYVGNEGKANQSPGNHNKGKLRQNPFLVIG